MSISIYICILLLYNIYVYIIYNIYYIYIYIIYYIHICTPTPSPTYIGKSISFMSSLSTSYHQVLECSGQP